MLVLGVESEQGAIRLSSLGVLANNGLDDGVVGQVDASSGLSSDKMGEAGKTGDIGSIFVYVDGGGG